MSSCFRVPKTHSYLLTAPFQKHCLNTRPELKHKKFAPLSPKTAFCEAVDERQGVVQKLYHPPNTISQQKAFLKINK